MFKIRALRVSGPWIVGFDVPGERKYGSPESEKYFDFQKKPYKVGTNTDYIRL